MHMCSFCTGFSSTLCRYVDRGLTVIVLTNQCAGGQRMGPCSTDEPVTLASGIAASYEPNVPSHCAYAPRARPQSQSHEEPVQRFCSGERRPYLPTWVVAERPPNLFRLERLQGAFKGITALTFIACQDTNGRRNAYDETAVCFYKADGAPVPYLTVGFTRSARIAYVMPEM